MRRKEGRRQGRPSCGSWVCWVLEGRAPLVPCCITHHHLCPGTFPPLQKGWLPCPPQNRAWQQLEGPGRMGKCWLGLTAARERVAGERGTVITTTDGTGMTLHGRAIIY